MKRQRQRRPSHNATSDAYWSSFRKVMEKKENKINERRRKKNRFVKVNLWRSAKMWNRNEAKVMNEWINEYFNKCDDCTRLNREKLSKRKLCKSDTNVWEMAERWGARAVDLTNWRWNISIYIKIVHRWRRFYFLMIRVEKFALRTMSKSIVYCMCRSTY